MEYCLKILYKSSLYQRSAISFRSLQKLTGTNSIVRETIVHLGLLLTINDNTYLQTLYYTVSVADCLFLLREVRPLLEGRRVPVHPRPPSRQPLPHPTEGED